MLGLYVHIPFCKSICRYCDFRKRVPKDNLMIKEYLKHLKEEFNSLNQKFDTIYIGGGTPSMLEIEDLTYLLEIFKDLDVLEYTFEANPESLSLEKIKLLKKYNVSRISLGVETFNDKLLKIINRRHTKDLVIEVINNLKLYFDNINIDLMFALPYQTLDMVKEDLDEFLKLDINHLSYYSLILEEKTPLYIDYLKDKVKLTSIEDEELFYTYIIDYLNKHGYKQYEISNFCKNKESIHNKIYWNYDNYIGIGLNASSKFNNRRYQNHHLFDKYYLGILEEDLYLDNIDLLKENMMMSLRLLKGVNIDYINNLYNVDIFKLFNIDKLIKDGLLIIEDNYLHLTKKGVLLGNIVFMEFI